MLGFKLAKVRFRAQSLTHPLSERVDEFGQAPLLCVQCLQQLAPPKCVDVERYHGKVERPFGDVCLCTADGNRGGTAGTGTTLAAKLDRLADRGEDVVRQERRRCGPKFSARISTIGLGARATAALAATAACCRSLAVHRSVLTGCTQRAGRRQRRRRSEWASCAAESVAPRSDTETANNPQRTD